MNPKRLLLLLPLAAFASCSTAPFQSNNGVDFQPGTWRLSGDVGYASNGTGALNGTSTQLGGSIGYFVTESTEVGLGGDYEDINPEGSSASLENTSLNIFGRYYTSTNSPTRFFGELAAGLGTTSSGSLENDLGTFAGSVGVLHFFAEDLAWEFALEKTFYGISGAADTDSWSGSVGISWIF